MLYSKLTPSPNRQTFLEDTFPSNPAPSPQNVQVTKEKAKFPTATTTTTPAGGVVAKPPLSIRNTLIKTLLDQTVGALINNFLFASFTYSIQEAMSHRLESPAFARPESSLAFLLSGRAIDYSRVDWEKVLAKALSNLKPIMLAGWKLWPAVSLVNFALIKSVEMRNLVGALAGVGWGIYVSLVAAGG